MKHRMKQTLSVLLSIVMVLSLFAGLSLPAFAEADFTIGTVEEWNAFVQNAAANSFYAGKTVELKNDIGTAKEPVTTICDSIFCGTFDGNGYTITADIDRPGQDVALFDTLSNATVKNLTLAGTIKGGEYLCAGIALTCYDSCQITGVTVTADLVTDAQFPGGVVGNAYSSSVVEIRNCEFLGNVIMPEDGDPTASFGGFVGSGAYFRSLTIANCVFSGVCLNAPNFNTIGFYFQRSGTVTVDNVITNTADSVTSLDEDWAPLYTGTNVRVAKACVVNGTDKTYYDTFDEAYWAWAKNTELVLLDDAVITESIVAPNTNTLDLHGHGVLMKGNDLVISIHSHKLNLKDSAPTVRRQITLDETGRGVSAAPGHAAQETAALKNVTGGYLTGGKVGVEIINGGQLTMTGGTVIGNVAEMIGGIYVGTGTLIMTGGSVVYNTATGDKGVGGVWLDLNRQFMIADKCLIQNNVCKNDAGGPKSSNVQLGNNAKIVFSGQLAPESRIGVTMASSGVFTSGMAANTDAPNAVKSNFTSDDPAYMVGVNDSGEAYLGKACRVVYHENGATDGSAPVDPNSPYLSGETVTVLGNTGNLEKTDFLFDGWNTVAGGAGGMAYAEGNTFTITEDVELYAQWEYNGTSVPPYAAGDVLEFGMYPQTEITTATDAETYAALNGLSLDWQSLCYWSGSSNSIYVNDKTNGEMTEKDFWKYTDVEYEGVRYRAVTSDHYRPWDTATLANDDLSTTLQDDNGYHPGNVYWFRYEPLRWRVLDPEAGLAICEPIVDSQPFNNYILYDSGSRLYYGDAAKQYYAADYEHSSLRAWLNGTFLNTAFSAADQAIIASTTLDDVNLTDKLFLLTQGQAGNTAWFANANARKTPVSDYAASQGQCDITAAGTSSTWWLRTPATSNYSSDIRSACGPEFSCGTAYDTMYGVRPAMTADLNEIAAAEFAAYKETKTPDAGKLGQEGDPAACGTLISQAQTAVGEMAYNKSKDMAGNKQAVDAVIAQLNSDLAEARAADFNAYKAEQKDAADAQGQDGDSVACQALIAQAKADIDALTYDGTATPAENKQAVDLIVTQLANDLTAQREAEAQAAADQAAADAVEAKIDAIGEVAYSDESKAKIDEARAAYDALTPAQQALVENADVLTAAEARYAELKAEAQTPEEPVQRKECPICGKLHNHGLFDALLGEFHWWIYTVRRIITSFAKSFTNDSIC